MMTLAAIALVLPAAYYHSQFSAHRPFSIGVGNPLVDGTGPPEDTHRGLMTISHGTAVLLLLVYIAYLFFEVRPPLYRRGFHVR